MSSNANAGADPDVGGDDGEDYDDMLESVDAAIDEARRKVESGRVRDAENERVRIKWIRALAYAVNVRRQVTADRDLQELGDRLDRLEAEGDVDK